MSFEQSIQQFFAENGFQLVKEIKRERAYVVNNGPRGAQVMVKIEPLDAEHRPGKPKGKARGAIAQESARMEEVFKLMKDYRFFKLCLPAVFGMGRYQDLFDWTMYKYYEGERYQWSEYDTDADTLGGRAIPAQAAADMAMMVFDFTQVPVLKFNKKVPTKNYVEDIAVLTEQVSVLVAAEVLTQQEVETALQEFREFYDKKIPTLYTIQNGNFYPRNFLRLTETIVVFDWESAQITTVEEVVAYMYILMWENPEWQKRFLVELAYLLEIQHEWLTHMIRYRALKQLIFWEAFKKNTLHSGMQAMKNYFQKPL
ncbi:MAG: hypothetical protein HYV32_05700 [Candidatus Kerfeldbacteria bacterium]|nr:hypothetical protein [Candidatus Kerfeldbacteria bacterium]